MSISLKSIRTERQWRASTGLTKEQFYKLVDLFSSAYEEIFGESLGEKSSDQESDVKFNTYEDLLFFGLYSIKSGLTYDLLGLSFDLSPSNVHAKQGMVLSVLQSALEQGGYMPKRIYNSNEEFIADWNNEGAIMVDGTEQRRQRPKNQILQKKDYSGKKKHIR